MTVWLTAIIICYLYHPHALGSEEILGIILLVIHIKKTFIHHLPSVNWRQESSFCSSWSSSSMKRKPFSYLNDCDILFRHYHHHSRNDSLFIPQNHFWWSNLQSFFKKTFVTIIIEALLLLIFIISTLVVVTADVSTRGENIMNDNMMFHDVMRGEDEVNQKEWLR